MVFETKADYDDTVFILKQNKLVKCQVKTIVIKQYTLEKIIYEYKLKADNGEMFSEYFSEDNIFLSKEDLVANLLKDETY